MKYSVFAALAALGMALSGCATVVKGTHEDITVRTMPAARADCTLRNDDGNWHVTTPGTVSVARTRRDMTIDCAAPGYTPGRTVARSHFNAVTLGNVVAGGLIGVGVDAATGANYSYDDRITVPLGPAEMTEQDPTALPAQPMDWRTAPQGPAADAMPSTRPTPQLAATPQHPAPVHAWQPVPAAPTMPDAPADTRPGGDEPPAWGEPPG